MVYFFNFISVQEAQIDEESINLMDIPAFDFITIVFI